MAQIDLSNDNKAGFRALRAAQATLPTTFPFGSRVGDVLNSAVQTDYTVPAPVQYVILKTDATGTAAIFEYADLAAMKTAVAAMS